MIIHEPATLLTDYLLAFLGALLACRLKKESSLENPAALWWHRSLILLSLSAFVGGSYHGFAANFPSFIDELWWRVVLWIICGVGFSLGRGLIAEVVAKNRQDVWNQIILMKFVASSILGILFPFFFIAIIDYGSVMVAWLAAAFITRRAWSGWIIFAVSLSGIAAWIQQSHSSYIDHFNHNDLFHLVQAIALVGFYRAARVIQKQELPQHGSTVS